ncbi:MAG: UDP-N-acetylmuramoyl-L-alanine--D-glutamate ligase [Acetivibrionales bacterium]
MNKKLDTFKREIKNKKVAVLGIGVSNTPLIKYLARLNVDITAFDSSDEVKLQERLSDLKEYNVKYSLGGNYLSNLKGFDIIFKTPVIRPDIPELADEKKRGAIITSEMEVFFELCPAEIFAVTGSDGKTTTTTLIYNMLNTEGYKCWLGGNIGKPLLDSIDEIFPTDKVVLELSSFQLHTMKQSPNVAVITNLSPNHLDIHKSMDEYVEAKKNIFKYQTSKDRLVLNYDNEITKNFINESKGDTVFFSRLYELEFGAYIKDGRLKYKENDKAMDLLKSEDILLPGVHNVENYLAAISAVIGHVSTDTVYKVATTFKGVEHRIEPVRELNGVMFYNDSIASSPSRTIAGLKSFNKKVILIAGGKDKKNNYDLLGKIMVDKVKCLILIGETAPMIEKVLRSEVEKRGIDSQIPVITCSTLEEAVNNAYSNASSGDIVILSPASTSFDMFTNFEERGNRFKEIVNSL